MKGFPLLIFFASGAAGLGYQIAWLKMFATGVGHEMPAALAVVCAFMGGMGLGAWILDKPICRSQRPGYWYAVLEFLIGLWAFLSPFLIPLFNHGALHAIGLDPSPLRHWAIAFAFPFLVILPATAAMGATFPAMERWLSSLAGEGRWVGSIYAANTFGAVTGTLLSAFFLVPAFGLRQSIWCLGLVNLVCGAVAFFIGNQRKGAEVDRWALTKAELPTRTIPGPRLGRAHSRGLGKVLPAEASVPAGTPALAGSTLQTQLPTSRERVRLGLTIFSTGLLGIGYETVGIRVMSQVLENTVYTFAAVLSVFLLGTALGAALYQRWGRRSVSLANSRSADFSLLLSASDERDGKRPEGRAPRAAASPNSADLPLAAGLLLTDLLCGLSLAGFIGVFTLWRAQPLYDACRNALGDSRSGVLGAEVFVAATVFGLPTIFMGAIFSHLVQAARLKEGGVGQAAALNTFGGALAPAFFGICLFPVAGSKWTLTLISLGYLALLPKVSGWRWGLFAAPFVSLFLLPANLRLVQVPPGGKLAEYREGVMDSVAVIEDAHTNRTLRVNNRFQMGGTAAADAEYRHAHIPLLLHPAPKRALFLGLGTGITFGAASLHPNLESDGVELVPEVVAIMPQFEPYNYAPDRQPALKLHVADARRFIRATESRYDVIVADLFHPARDGAGGLYTVEHFQAVRQRLAPGGIFCQWLPLHQLDEDMLRIIVRTFLEVFPDAQAYLLRLNVDAPVIGLVGSLDWPRYSPLWVEMRLDASTLAAPLKKLALADSIRFFGALLAGPKELLEFAGNAPLNTDDRPRVTFGAPQFTYQKKATSYGRLVALLKHHAANPREVLRLGSDPEANQFASRLSAFMAARDVYLKGLIEETEGHPAAALDAFVESARLSEDFTAGYAQCLTIASLEAKSNPEKARSLLQRLVDAQPGRPVAAQMLKRLRGD